jgi:hypothetical protein
MIQGKVTDDRAPSSAPFYPALNSAAAAILDNHADKSPRHYTISDTAFAEHTARETDARHIADSNLNIEVLDKAARDAKAGVV